MTFGIFLRENFRWLLGGITLTFFSSAGQTFYIALFAGDIRQAFHLSHGEFGGIYMLATFASAVTLVFIGRAADVYSVRQIASAVVLLLATACLLMAGAGSPLTLALALYCLRLFGQGMMSHIALTAMGRWFRRERGRAVSVTTIGHQLGEGILPIGMVLLLGLVEWRTVWVLSALALVLIALPVLRRCFAHGRQPGSATQADREQGRQWTRSEVLADGPFWIVCTSVLAPAFIGTSMFFHQVHIGESKGWEPSVIAGSFAVLSIATVGMGLLTGQLIDRYSARRLLPLFLLPLGLACIVLSTGERPATAPVFMLLVGVSYGISSVLFGAVWPEIYGVRHLGDIRSLVYAAMVFSSALGPGVTGWLIDAGIDFERQLLFMAAYCFLSVGTLTPVSRHLLARDPCQRADSLG